MASDDFFEAPEEQNVVKTQIVSKYFWAWSRVLLANTRTRADPIAYFDLYSGPGQYGDGSPSTPILILNQAIADPILSARLATVFNDRNPIFAERLRLTIAGLPGIEKLRHPPVVNEAVVGTDLVALFRRQRFVPTLFFIDPWGYQGLSLELIGSTIKDWGCECILFFNYNRVNPGINNPKVVAHMNELFGAERANKLRATVAGRTPDERQTMIVNELTEALKTVGGKHVLPFEFESQHGERPSHYIVFVSKAFAGYHLMKEVMAGLSSDEGAVRQFRYVPVKSTQMELFPGFGRSHSIPHLQQVMLQSLAGRSLTVWESYAAITVDTPYTLKNVKDALMTLEAEGKITIDPPAARRKKGTLAKEKVVTFPV